MRHWRSDSDPAIQAAEARLSACLKQLSSLGLEVDGQVGDADPLQVVDDALATFPATELVIATDAEPRSNWLAHDVVGRALARFGPPTVPVVGDVAARDAEPAPIAA